MLEVWWLDTPILNTILFDEAAAPSLASVKTVKVDMDDGMPLPSKMSNDAFLR